MRKLGICPITSEEFLGSSINHLQKKHVLDCLDQAGLDRDVAFLSGLMPDHYFPDCYLDLPLMGGESEGITVVLDCYERCYLDYHSSGVFFREFGLPAMNHPENRDDLLLLRVKDGRLRVETADRRMQDALNVDIPAFRRLSEYPLSWRIKQCEEGIRVIMTAGLVWSKNRYRNLPYKRELMGFLDEIGVRGEQSDVLDNASFNLGFPFYHKEQGYMNWVSYVDVAAFIFTVRDSVITDCHAQIRISDKSMIYDKELVRRMHAYQWHITDNCDQRCRHCYLFAEDAALNCVSTPFDQLIMTLDQIEMDAQERAAVPYLVVSGGDPLLHPRFWDFAGELHKRGIQWCILGNPFHLNEEVCKKLYQLGCMSYQQSMDGLKKFHDYMRKPGSFDATLHAIKLLNDAGIKATLMATVSRQNLEDVLACMDIAVKHHAFGFGFARYCATSPEKALEAYPSPEEYRDFLLRYYQKAKAFQKAHCDTDFAFKEHLFTLLRYELGEFKPPQYSIDHPDIVYDGCHLGKTCAILPDGTVMACRRMDSRLGNAGSDMLHNITTSDLCKSYVNVSNIKKCKDCELLQWCRGCRAAGFNVTGDLQCEDPCCWKIINKKTD